ncbi:WecB/TagA/CpsF family glycosyltransferase [Gordonia sp. UBA6683]|uniref:WecB/TagA/CpsF family glycosyltransferase n=1 Tax=Gordonia sp. UBA6683 TaxID=1946577 RepID=UPI0039C8B0EE
MKRREVCGFVLDGGAYSDVLSLHEEWLVDSRQRLSYALHVGGLNIRSDTRYVDAFNSCDFAYADGMSVVLLARLAGLSGVERCPTTDLGSDLLKSAKGRLGREIRTALIGGPPDRLSDISLAFRSKFDVAVCYQKDGYSPFTSEDSVELKNSEPDLVLVGMGMPLEAHFCTDYRDMLPSCLIMTCGGWFGFVCGTEKRAPRIMRVSGVEWVYRLAQSPRRLGRRYLLGLVTFSVEAAKARRSTSLRQKG